MELEQVQQLYEKQKHDPPISRNLPPVAGNITWSRWDSPYLAFLWDLGPTSEILSFSTTRHKSVAFGKALQGYTDGGVV